jgi:hypothetical protein
VTPGEFYERALMYCNALGASMTSGKRSNVHNASKAVKGVTFSAHRFGLAVDVVYDAPIPEKERKETASRLGLRCIIEGDHDHLQPHEWIAG